MKRFIVGANNKTKKLEKQKTYGIVGGYSDGFTSYETTGSWKGKKERSLVVEVEGLSSKNAHKLAKDLARVLKQKSVMVQQVNTRTSFIG